MQLLEQELQSKDWSYDHADDSVNDLMLRFQNNIKQINDWTEKQQMQLNPKKTKNMIFNFSTNNQFTCSVTVQDEPVEIVNQTKLLGTIIQNNLKNHPIDLYAQYHENRW